MATAATRPYHVTIQRDQGGTPASYLVEAINPNQAIRHVIKGTHAAKACNGKEVAELMAKGVKYEQAAAEPDGVQAEIPA